MRIWKFAALVALAAIPILLFSRKDKKGEIPVAGDPDNIFESELTVD